jgi:thiosulfate/3-mercaptopyruvate sulfurtransferase
MPVIRETEESGKMAGYANEVLVEQGLLEEHLDDSTVRILEVDEDSSLYAEGHIPGAIVIDWRRDMQDTLRRDFVGREPFAELLGSRGVSNDHIIVLYGDHSNWFAAYAYWLLRYHGFEDVYLLDGAREKWERDGRPMTTETPHHEPRALTLPGGGESLRAGREEILERGGDLALVDVRSPEEYEGVVIAPPGYATEGAQRAGHIPGAVSIPWSRVLNEDGTFKGADDLRSVYGDVLGAPTIVPYCRIGERSAHSWFVLHELLGLEDVRNYDGSWTEWGSLVGAPIALGAQP